MPESTHTHRRVCNLILITCPAGKWRKFEIADRHCAELAWNFNYELIASSTTCKFRRKRTETFLRNNRDDFNFGNCDDSIGGRKPRVHFYFSEIFIVVLNAEFSRGIKAQIRHGYVNVKKESLPLYRKGC